MCMYAEGPGFETFLNTLRLISVINNKINNNKSIIIILIIVNTML